MTVKEDDKVVSFEEAQNEDPQEAMLSFLVKHKKRWIQLGLAVLMGFLGVQALEAYQQHAIRKVQAAYTEATTVEAKMAFAQAHSSSPLAGAVFMEAGDAAYLKGEYAQAAEYYEQAIRPLVKTPFSAQAQLGAAASEAQLGQAESARKRYEKLLSDPSILQVFHAEAMYQLAILDLQAEQPAEARRRFELLAQGSMGASSIWQQKAQMMLEAL